MGPEAPYSSTSTPAWEPVRSWTPGERPTGRFGRRSAHWAGGSRWLRSPGSRNCWTAERVMRSWVGGDLTEAGRELLILRWAVSSADRETVERDGGLNTGLKKINQLTQATPEPMGLGMIDDFHLWGSRLCPAYACANEKGTRYREAPIGGVRIWQRQICTLRGRSPRCCGRDLAWKALLEAVWHGISASAGTTVAGRPSCALAAAGGSPCRFPTCPSPTPETHGPSTRV